MDKIFALTATLLLNQQLEIKFAEKIIKKIMFDPPISSGANMFIWIVAIGLAFAAAIAVGDMLKENRKNKPTEPEEK